jgi:hypothetical protein
MNGKQLVTSILKRGNVDRIVYAPNYWQWFSHTSQHGKLPAELAHCKTQIDMIKQLGLDVFSRNSYCDQNRRWFGGLSDELIDNGSVTVQEQKDGHDLVFTRTYHTRKGDLQERQRYVWQESTLVQEKFLVDDYAQQIPLLEELLQARHWKFQPDRYQATQDIIGDDGMVVAGELHSPLKMLHLLMGPVETVYFITDHPELAKAFMKQNEEIQLELVHQMADAGVNVMMAMDNLDTMFHPPAYIDQYCASFYEQASSICHQKDAAFFIHACGQQKDNLKLISSYGVDGLEGVAYPPLGDVELDQAMRLTGDRFIITGGISAMEFEGLHERSEIFQYVRKLFEQMSPYANRFMFSASCNTPINASWDAIRWFRDAWLEYGSLS